MGLVVKPANNNINKSSPNSLSVQLLRKSPPSPVSKFDGENEGAREPVRRAALADLRSFPARLQGACRYLRLGLRNIHILGQMGIVAELFGGGALSSRLRTLAELECR